MEEREIEYSVAGLTLVGRLITKGGRNARPGVLVAHDWGGRNELALNTAARLAKLGYSAFALDMYGGARVCDSMEERAQRMGELIANRAMLMARMQAALSAMCQQAEVDRGRTAAVGFCFGGRCVLDLARSGADVGGVVSFHGLLEPPPSELCKPITAQVLALHGYRDPMAKPDMLAAFEQEMLGSCEDFQVHVYGRAMHAFANPKANNPDFGTAYEPRTAHRAFRTMEGFLSDLFEGVA